VQSEIRVPALGESETQATLVAWLKREGEPVSIDEVLAEIESDKVTMEITAQEAGVLSRCLRAAGEVVHPGEVIGYLEVGAVADTAAAVAAGPAPAAPSESPAPTPAAAPESVRPEDEEIPARPQKPQVQAAEVAPLSSERHEERVPMSGLRRRIASRLKQAQSTAAILTTFNEANMQPVMDLRAKYRDRFKARHGTDLGITSFFVRACAEAVRHHPAINAYIEGEEVVYHNYFDVGIAVSTERGLVVPVLRDAHRMSMAEIERKVAEYAQKAREGGLMPDDLKGGTFSITNGGVFGSLLSTPILNPPQSAILGLHAIKKRAVVEEDRIVIRPMMYLALSYDHRLIDGKDAVQFLVKVKETLEYPAALLLDL